MRLLILLIIVLITYRVTKYVKADAANTVSIVVTVVGIVISCVDIVKNVFNDVLITGKNEKSSGLGGAHKTVKFKNPDFRGQNGVTSVTPFLFASINSAE